MALIATCNEGRYAACVCSCGGVEHRPFHLIAQRILQDLIDVLWWCTLDVCQKFAHSRDDVSDQLYDPGGDATVLVFRSCRTIRCNIQGSRSHNGMVAASVLCLHGHGDAYQCYRRSFLYA